MSKHTYDGECPDCGRTFTLAELRYMAVGDGLQRWLRVKREDGTIAVVRFDDYNPATMDAMQ